MKPAAPVRKTRILVTPILLSWPKRRQEAIGGKPCQLRELAAHLKSCAVDAFLGGRYRGGWSRSLRGFVGSVGGSRAHSRTSPMANTKSAKKAARQTVRRTGVNKIRRSHM